MPSLISGIRLSAPVFWAQTLPGLGELITLDGTEGHHAARVLRVRHGEHIAVTDGQGNRVDATVSTVDNGSITAIADTITHEPAPTLRLVVAQAIPKGDRGELAVELMTELGVDEIIPWQAERCITRWKPDRVRRALAKWRAAAFAAAKQSRRSHFPHVVTPATTPDLARRVGVTRTFVLHESASTSLVDEIRALTASTEVAVQLVIGPEGGISDREIEDLSGAGARPVKLGREVLRTSTAGAAAITVVQAVLGRWNG